MVSIHSYLQTSRFSSYANDASHICLYVPRCVLRVVLSDYLAPLTENLEYNVWLNSVYIDIYLFVSRFSLETMSGSPQSEYPWALHTLYFLSPASCISLSGFLFVLVGFNIFVPVCVRVCVLRHRQRMKTASSTLLPRGYVCLCMYREKRDTGSARSYKAKRVCVCLRERERENSKGRERERERERNVKLVSSTCVQNGHNFICMCVYCRQRK